jgi:flagellar basal-body rod protein FlgB
VAGSLEFPESGHFCPVAPLLLGRIRCAMIEGMFSSPNYVAAQRMLDATMVRHEGIAANLANVQTPGYKRVDVEPGFRQALSKAVAAGDVAALRALRPSLAADATAVSLRPDGNTVQVESEMLKLSQNSAEHALELQMITGSLLRMRLAITGKG